MRITVLIATYGSQEWRVRGDRAADAVPRGANDVIRVHRSDMTLAEVRNYGASGATPGWLCFLDADDRLHPDYCSAMRATRGLRVNETPAAARDYDQRTLYVPSIGYGGSARAEIPAWLANLSVSNCAVIGTLVHRDLFEQVGGFRDTLADGTPLTSLEDWDLWLRCVKAGAVMVPVPEAIYLARAEDRSDGARRNSDQSPYEAIRREHADFNWGDVRAYKVGYPEMARS